MEGELRQEVRLVWPFVRRIRSLKNNLNFLIRIRTIRRIRSFPHTEGTLWRRLFFQISKLQFQYLSPLSLWHISFNGVHLWGWSFYCGCSALLSKTQWKADLSIKRLFFRLFLFFSFFWVNSEASREAAGRLLFGQLAKIVRIDRLLVRAISGHLRRGNAGLISKCDIRLYFCGEGVSNAKVTRSKGFLLKAGGIRNALTLLHDFYDVYSKKNDYAFIARIEFRLPTVKANNHIII